MFDKFEPNPKIRLALGKRVKTPLFPLDQGGFPPKTEVFGKLQFYT
jgi:hypothetical protein